MSLGQIGTDDRGLSQPWFKTAKLDKMAHVYLKLLIKHRTKQRDQKEVN